MYVQLYVEQDLRWLKPLESLLFFIYIKLIVFREIGYRYKKDWLQSEKEYEAKED